MWRSHSGTVCGDRRVRSSLRLQCTGMEQARGMRDPSSVKLETDLEAIRNLPVEGQEVESGDRGISPQASAPVLQNEERRAMPARPVESLLALLSKTGTYSVEPKSVGMLSSCLVMYPVIRKTCQPFDRLELDEGLTATHTCRRALCARLCGLWGTTRRQRVYKFVRNDHVSAWHSAERTDKAQVEHLFEEQKAMPAGNVSASASPAVTIHPVGSLNALDSDAPEEGGSEV